MSDRPSISVEELLPAMIELASIQHDLMRQLERPTPSIGPIAGTGASRAGDPPSAHGELRQLLLRSRELLAWLLSKAGVPP